MNRGIHIGTAVLAALAMAGCVSTGEFEKMQAGKDQEITVLKQQNSALEQDNSALKQQLASTRQQVGSLEQQQTELLATSRERQQEYDALVQRLSKEVEQGHLQVRQYQNMLSVDLAEQIFFDSGRAKLKPGGRDVLKQVGEALKGYEDKIIRVVGHTDNVPIAPSLQRAFPTNWELSVARATNVVRFLQEVGVPPDRMMPAGRSEYDPVASNDTPEGRQENRRIEILLIDRSLVGEMNRKVK